MNKTVKSLLLLPSTWGLFTWVLWYPLYCLRLIEWDLPFLETHFVAFGTIGGFFFATIVFMGCRELRRDFDEVHILQGSAAFSLACTLHVAGFLGFGLFLHGFLQNSSLGDFLKLLFYDSHIIRNEAARVVPTIGYQLSYLGWIGIAASAVFFRTRTRGWRLLSTLGAIQFLANLLFIDRTRPIWVLTVVFFVIFVISPMISSAKIAGRGIAFVVFVVVIFNLVASWVGKVYYSDAFNNSILPAPLQGFYFYGTAGFPYLNYILVSEPPGDGLPERTLYPLIKLLAVLGFVPPPPEQINEFYDLPFSTNVGTFLEPFYRDGGLPFVLIGIVLHSFGFNLLAIFAYRRFSFLKVFFVANLVFSNLISAFTPKFASAPLWLFALFALGEYIVRGLLAGREESTDNILKLPTRSIIAENGEEDMRERGLIGEGGS